MGLFNEVYRAAEEFLVDGFHALSGERTRVLYLLRAVGVGPGMDHAAGTELFPERGVLRIIHVLRFLLRIQVVEIAEEFIEAVVRRQMLIQVAEMVLAELACRIAERLQQLGDGRIELGQTSFAPGSPTLVRPVRMGDCR